MELVNPGLGLIFWMSIAFAFLLIILRKFVWPPILKALHQREQSITDALNAAEITKKEMETLKFNNEALLKEAKEERDALIRDARKMRDNIIDEAKLKASEEANRLVASAMERIENEKMAAITDLKNQVAQLSIEIAEKILKAELSDKEKQQEIISRQINEMNFN